MSYAVKELFITLQGEGVHSGRLAVFCRFAGCNLWSGVDKDRSKAICKFCDTDFVGTDGENGGKFSADGIAQAAANLWGPDRPMRFIVLTGGEPMLQVDDALVDALHAQGFEIAIESNGTIPVHPGIDWVCISPKSGSEVVQKSGDELKLVWPQAGYDPVDFESWDFRHFLIQPMDSFSQTTNAHHQLAAMEMVEQRPNWRLSLQNHKTLGIA